MKEMTTIKREGSCERYQIKQQKVVHCKCESTPPQLGPELIRPPNQHFNSSELIGFSDSFFLFPWFFFLLFRLIINLNLTLMQHFRGFHHWEPSSNQLFNSIELDSLQFCFRWSILDFILAVIRHLRRYLTAVYHSWFLNVTNIFENVISVVFSFGLSGLLRQLLKVLELLQSSFEFWNFFRNSFHYVHNVIGNK